MPRRRATSEERQYLEAVASLPCMVCTELRNAEVHHALEFRMGQRKASHWHTIPLCPWHHRTGPHGEAIHAGAKTWRDRFGSETYLVQLTQEMVMHQYGIEIPEEARVVL